MFKNGRDNVSLRFRLTTAKFRFKKKLEKKHWKSNDATAVLQLVRYRCFVTAPQVSFRCTRYFLASGRDARCQVFYPDFRRLEQMMQHNILSKARKCQEGGGQSLSGRSHTFTEKSTLYILSKLDQLHVISVRKPHQTLTIFPKPDHVIFVPDLEPMLQTFCA